MIRAAAVVRVGILLAAMPVGCASAQTQAPAPPQAPGSVPSASAPARADRGYTGLDIRSAATIAADGAVIRAYPVIRSVEADSPGHQAGFATGDVILEINGADSRQDLATVFRPAIRYSIRIRRGEEEREIVLVPGPPATATNSPSS